jgi:hypothetical protein
MELRSTDKHCPKAVVDGVGGGNMDKESGSIKSG